MTAKYQLLPDLRPEERAALKADIARRGILIPIEKDEQGAVLDGHNRQAIAQELGIRCPEIVRPFASEQEKREHVILVHLARRHLDPIRWGLAFEKLLEERGIQKGERARNDLTGATVASVATEMGVPERTAKHRLAAARAYKALPDPVKVAVDAGALTLPQARRQVERVKKTKVLQAKAARNGTKQSRWAIEQGDCLPLMQAQRAGCARLVFADPPYNIGIDYGQGKKADQLPASDYLVWCQAWMQEAKRLLTDDGSLWVLICHEWAARFAELLEDEIKLTIRRWITWYETFGVNCANNFNRCSRALLYCVKDPKRFVFHAETVSRPSDRQDKYHDKRADPAGKLWDDVWVIPRLVENSAERISGFPTQLPLDLLRPIVGCASDPGDLVLDPFCGSGTTGHAAIEAKRQFLGMELSKKFASLATLRLKGLPDPA
jgi:site-specific DNA-methyltransferase (adenine-specific)